MAPKRKPDPDGPGDKVFDWGEIFIAAIGEGKSPTDAAIEAGVSRQAPYERKWAHPEFKKAWEMALDVRTERLEASLYKRAVHGLVVGTTWEVNADGERVKTGETRKFSDNVGVFMLKAYDRERFGDQVRVDQTGTVNHRHEVEVLDGRQPAQVSGSVRRQIAALLEESAGDVVDGTEAA
jgi:hypothetical protein